MGDFIKFVLGCLVAVMLLGWVFDAIKGTAYVYKRKERRRKR
jgi:hypothetical protein